MLHSKQGEQRIDVTRRTHRRLRAQMLAIDASRMLQVVVLVVAGFALQGCRSSPQAAQIDASAPVVMVCEHGSVKSLMAASLFNHAAAQRHLPFRAIARGVTPDEAVPVAIAEALTQEGFAVRDFVPVRVSAADVAGASRVIAIGVQPESLHPEIDASIETWADVPAASVDYNAARASLEQHVEALLSELQRKGVR